MLVSKASYFILHDVVSKDEFEAVADQNVHQHFRDVIFDFMHRLYKMYKCLTVVC